MKSDLRNSKVNLPALFDILFVSPMNRMSSSITGTKVIVIDALDEVEESENHEMFLYTRNFFKFPKWVKALFITTRPQSHTLSTFVGFNKVLEKNRK